MAGIPLAKVSPAFLHGNSTSHTWAFSAVAELIDNAYDPDVNASELLIDKRLIEDVVCLTFLDNGNGMNENKLLKMLSFGYCEKESVGRIKPIGQYGNGFKSGSMRLGKDALVFTRCPTSASVGFLSQTYLEVIRSEAVVVPIVTWDLPHMTRRQPSESSANLEAFLNFSLFKTEEDIINELMQMTTGTKIIIYNLKRAISSDCYELDFASDPEDIRNPETHVEDLEITDRPIKTKSPEYRHSLRAYCSILYLKPRMKIVLRGHKVKTKLISKSLLQTKTDKYKPRWLSQPVKLTFGFTDDQEPESYGLMMYHDNRLITAYEKIGCQKKANDQGVGVVGVVEVNFLNPIHNKQDFERTDKYNAFMQRAAVKLDDYYVEKTHNENSDSASSTNQSQDPWTWVQCDNSFCLKWRRLPTGYKESLPEKWFCRMNPDASFNRCDMPEEPEDAEEDLKPSYKKRKEKKKKKAGEAQKSSSLDLERLHEEVAVKERSIQLLDDQKKEIEQRTQAMLRMADNKQQPVQNMQLICGTSSSIFSSTSHSLKRKSDSEGGHGAGDKVIKIKPEHEGNKPVKEEKSNILIVNKESQTDVKFSSPEEEDLEMLPALEQRHLLLQYARELKETKHSLASLQQSIVKLLSIIAPELNIDNPKNVESVIQAFVEDGENPC